MCILNKWIYIYMCKEAEEGEKSWSQKVYQGGDDAKPFTGPHGGEVTGKGYSRPTAPCY